MRKKGSNRVSSFLFLVPVTLLICSIIFTIISCGISNDSSGNSQDDYDLNSSSFFIDDEPEDNTPAETAEISNEYMKTPEKINIGLAEKNNGFAFKVFTELIKEDKDINVFISPFSISTALAMTYNGASGQTEKDMATALNFNDMTVAEINEDFKLLISNIEIFLWAMMLTNYIFTNIG